MARGSIRERSGPTGQAWELRVYLGSVEGRPRYLTRTVRGKRRVAERALNALMAEADAGAFSGPDASVERLIERWKDHNAPDWSPSTRAAYEVYLRRHIVPALGAMAIKDVTPADLDALYGRLRLDLAPASVAKVHAVLCRAFGQAVRWGWLPISPTDRATPPKVSRPEIAPPSRPDLRRLLVAAESQPMFATFLRLAATTGARRGELCALRWSDLYLERRELVIARSIVLGTRSVGEKGTKSGKRRRIGLDSGTVARLVAHRERCEKLAASCGAGYGEGAYLFSSEPDGSVPWRPDGVTKRFTKLRNEVGLPDVRLHDLRHEHVTFLLGQGSDIRTVAGRVGHSQASTTLNIYASWLPSADRRAAELMGDLDE